MVSELGWRRWGGGAEVGEGRYDITRRGVEVKESVIGCPLAWGVHSLVMYVNYYQPNY